MVDDDGIIFPDLALTCSRLCLDSGELVEAILSGMDAGSTEREAVTMSIVEVLQQRGAYHGRLKQAIDDGTIFQLQENADGGWVRGRYERMGGKRSESDAVASTPRLIRNTLDDE